MAKRKPKSVQAELDRIRRTAAKIFDMASDSPPSEKLLKQIATAANDMVHATLDLQGQIQTTIGEADAD